jgi:hypothetical protein
LEQIKHALSHIAKMGEHFVAFQALIPHLSHILSLLEHEIQKTLDFKGGDAHLDVLAHDRLDDW